MHYVIDPASGQHMPLAAAPGRDLQEIRCPVCKENPHVARLNEAEVKKRAAFYDQCPEVSRRALHVSAVWFVAEAVTSPRLAAGYRLCYCSRQHLFLALTGTAEPATPKKESADTSSRTRKTRRQPRHADAYQKEEPPPQLPYSGLFLVD